MADNPLTNMRALFVVVCLLAPGFAHAQPAPKAMPVTKVVKESLDDGAALTAPVVVELFTASSCVFCPQADQLFSQVAAQPGVIALACHVDYLKAGDPLAKDFCITRQNWYMDRLHNGPNYTPQLVVNGARDAVGYKTDKVTALVRERRGDGIEAIGITPLTAVTDATAFRVTLPDAVVKSGLAGLQLAVTTFRKSVAADKQDVRVADNMQVLPLDQYKGPDFKLTVPMGEAQAGVVVVLQRQDTGRVSAAGQFVKP